MKKINLVMLFTFLFLNKGFAQQDNTWISFWNKDSTLMGFKDKSGKVKITPKFSNYSTALRFDNIIGVSQELGGKMSDYYLTKKGKMVGKDSLYIVDNGPDCESEGFIRFRDTIANKVGMFNYNGNVAIPANYDNLMPVRNGMIMGIKGGRWDASQQSEDNQYPWVGGKELLIDTRNQVLVENFPLNEDLNFFSLIISEQPDRNPIRENFRGINGKYYSFVNFDKEFKAWLKSHLLNAPTKTNLNKVSYKDIAFWNESKGWLHQSKEQFINKNFNLIKSKLPGLNHNNDEYMIFTEGLDPYQHKSKAFEKYFDNCGASKDWIYPVKTLVITHHINKGIVQDQFSFLRMDTGYKLIEVSIRTAEVQL